MRWNYILLFGLWLQTAAAQTPAYLHFGVREGLPGNLVYCGLQDHNGLLWFGTDKGLACFDGMRFRTYGLEEGLPDPEILQMKEDKQGRLWLFCFQKDLCYLSGGRIFTYNEDPLLPKLDLTTGTNGIWEDDKGGMWHVEQSRTAYYSNKNGITKYHFPDPISSMQFVEGTFLVLGYRSVMRMQADGTIETLALVNTGHEPCVVSISGNRLLYSFIDRLILLEWDNGQIRQLAEVSEPAGRAYTDRSGRFWVCSTRFGAICFDNDKRDLSNPVMYLPDKKVTTMFEDTKGTFWFCTADEGVFGLPRNAPLIYNKTDFPSKNIRSLARNESGHLLVGDDIGNVNVLKNNTSQLVSFGSAGGTNLVRQIIPEGTGAFWAVTDEDLYFCDRDYSRIIEYGCEYSLKSIAIQPDKIWFAASTRMSYIQRDSQLEQLVIRRRFTTVSADKESNIWAGNISGLYSQSDSFQRNWGDFFPELKCKINTIQPAGENKIWIATSNNGLILATVCEGAIEQVKTINKQLKSPINNIQSLFPEPDGSVWMATNRGVFGLRPNGELLHFDAHDGLADDDVNSVLVNGDTLWAGSASGLTHIVLQPKDENGDFATFISGLRYQRDRRFIMMHLLDSISVQRKIILPPDATALELELACLDYESRGNLRFEVVQSELLPSLKWCTFNNLITWLIRGENSKKDTTQSKVNTFSLGAYLPPGCYRFQLTAIRATGVRSQNPDVWTVVKKPYWYQNIWFYLAIWGVLGYGIWRVYRARMAYRELNTAASVLQLQALQSQMNPHFIGNTINAIQQFLHPPNPVKTSEYLALFMRLLRRTMDFSEKTFIPFEEELTYEREYLKLVALRFEGRFQYEISGAGDVPADTPVPSMLLQPILENATIHGLAVENTTLIQMHFSLAEGQMRCVLTDNGLGIKATKRLKETSGFERESKGLVILHKKINTLNRLFNLDLNLVIEDLSESKQPQPGTRVILTYTPDKIWKAIKKRPGSIRINTT